MKNVHVFVGPRKLSRDLLSTRSKQKWLIFEEFNAYLRDNGGNKAKLCHRRNVVFQSRHLAKTIFISIGGLKVPWSLYGEKNGTKCNLLIISSKF